jgi:hypothetical protein
VDAESDCFLNSPRTPKTPITSSETGSLPFTPAGPLTPCGVLSGATLTPSGTALTPVGAALTPSGAAFGAASGAKGEFHDQADNAKKYNY